MKTSLCESCAFGLIREWDCEECKERHFWNKCLVDNEALLFPITMCNHYKKKADGKVTYHDPDFDEFESKLLGRDILKDGKLAVEGDVTDMEITVDGKKIVKGFEIKSVRISLCDSWDAMMRSEALKRKRGNNEHSNK